VSNYQYNTKTYENEVKKYDISILNGTYYVEGYCDMKQGRVFFKGDIGGVSKAQARFYIIYMLRDKYGEEVWINPIFYKIHKYSVNKEIKDRKLIFDLKKYEDNKIRNFIPFNKNERDSMENLKKTVGHLMPKVIESPLSNLGTSASNIGPSYITNSLVTSDINWNRDNLLCTIENGLTRYDTMDDNFIVNAVSKILNNDQLKDSLLKVLRTSLEEYMTNNVELIKVNNVIYDINDLTDILHYTKLTSIINVNDRNKLLTANKDLETCLNTLNSLATNTKNYITFYKNSGNTYDLEVLRDTYIKSLNNLNKIYCYTYDLKRYEYTISRLCRVYSECIFEFDQYLELQSYTYNDKYADKLCILNEELLNSIIIKIKLIIRQISYYLMHINNL